MSYKNIVNPITGKIYNINSREGLNIINNYRNKFHLGGMDMSSDDTHYAYGY